MNIQKLGEKFILVDLCDVNIRKVKPLYITTDTIILQVAENTEQPKTTYPIKMRTMQYKDTHIMAEDRYIITKKEYEYILPKLIRQETNKLLYAINLTKAHISTKLYHKILPQYRTLFYVYTNTKKYTNKVNQLINTLKTITH